MADEQRCVKSIGRFYSRYCNKIARFQEDGKWWCGTHAPSKVAAKQAVREAKYAENRKAEQKKWNTKKAMSRVVEAALAWDGNDHAELQLAINHLREVSR